MAKHVCEAIQNLASSTKANSGKVKEKHAVERFPSTHSMFSELQSLLVTQLSSTDSQHWCPLAQQAISMVYKLSDQPDKFAEGLLKNLVNEIVSSTQEDGEFFFQVVNS